MTAQGDAAAHGHGDRTTRLQTVGESLEAALRRVPLAVPAIALTAGIIVASTAAVPPIAWFAVAMIGATATWVIGTRRLPGPQWPAVIGIALAAASAGAILYESKIRRAPTDDIGWLAADERRLVRLTGTVAVDPVVATRPALPFKSWMSGVYHTEFLISCERIETGEGARPVSGLARGRVGEPMLALRRGDRIEALGWLYAFRPPSNPGQFDWRDRQHRSGVRAGFTSEHAGAVRVERDAARFGLGQVFSRVRSAARAAVLDGVLPDDPDTVSLIDAMLLGQRSRVEREINDAFVRTGTSHFLSVSGAHVTLLAASLWVVLAMVGVSRRRAATAVIVLVLLYAVVVEPRAPAIRAVIITVTFSVAVILRRPVATGNWIALSAIVILIVRPYEIFDAGFQLSFAVLLGIVLLARPIRLAVDRWVLRRDTLAAQLAEPVEPSHWVGDVLKRFGDGLLWMVCVSIAAWIVAGPISAYHFQQVSMWGWLATPILFPFVALCMWGGLLRGGMALLWPSAADRADVLLEWPAAALGDVALVISRVPTISWELAAPPIWWVAAFYVVIVLLLRPRVPALKWPALLGVTVLALSAAWRYVPIDAGRDGVRIRVLAVGDGTATVVALPDGRTMLYDAGTLGGFDAARTIIVPALRHDGVRRISHAHVSHPNLDHYSEVLGVHASVPIRELSVNAQFEPLADGGAAKQFLDGVEREAIPLRVLEPGEMMVAAAGVTFEALWPPAAEAAPGLSANDASTVLRLTYAGVRVLMCGDIGEAGQRALLESGADLTADVLVLPHHGAVVASTAEFVSAVGADVLIRSSGRGEERTSPALAAIVAGATYYNTADDGAVTIDVSRDGELIVTPFIKKMTDER